MGRFIKNHAAIIVGLLFILSFTLCYGYIFYQGKREPLQLQDIYGDKNILSELHVEGEYGSVFSAPDKVSFQFWPDGIQVTDYHLKPFTMTEKTRKEEMYHLKQRYPDRKEAVSSIRYETEQETQLVVQKEGKRLFSNLPKLRIDSRIKEELQTWYYILNGCVKLKDTYYAATVFNTDYYVSEMNNINNSYIKGEGGIFYSDKEAGEMKKLVTLRMEDGIPLNLFSYDGDLLLVRRKLGIIILELYSVDGTLLDSCELKEDSLPGEFLTSEKSARISVIPGIRVDEQHGYLCLYEQYYLFSDEREQENIKALLKIFKIKEHRIQDSYAFSTRGESGFFSGINTASTPAVWIKEGYLICCYEVRECSNIEMDVERLKVSTIFPPARTFLDVFSLRGEKAAKVYAGELLSNSGNESIILGKASGSGLVECNWFHDGNKQFLIWTK